MCQLQKKYESNPTNIETESQERIAIREFVKNQSMHTYGMPIAEYIENAIVDGFFLFNLRKDKYMVNSKQELLNYNADENVSLEEKLYFWDIFLYNQRPDFLSDDEHEYIREMGDLDGYTPPPPPHYNRPSMFTKPTLISDELAEFLGKTVGTEMARTEVTKEIRQYISANKLQDPANGRIRIIYPDEKLRKLLGLTNEDELNYFTLQKYLKPHFIK
jgi:chromatin remodeling complex protein RSC6